MYDIISEIISHSWQTSSSEQQYIYYTCCAMILLLTVTFVDLIKTTFAQFLRK